MDPSPHEKIINYIDMLNSETVVISRVEVKPFCEAFKSHGTLVKSLSFETPDSYDSNIQVLSPEEADMLAEAVCVSENLTDLSFVRVVIKDNGVLAIARGLFQNKNNHIYSLGFQAVGLKDPGLLNFGKVANDIKGLRVVNFSDNVGLTSTGLTVFAAAIGPTTCLNSISFERCENIFKGHGAAGCFKKLISSGNNCSLTEVKLPYQPKHRFQPWSDFNIKRQALVRVQGPKRIFFVSTSYLDESFFFELPLEVRKIIWAFLVVSHNEGRLDIKASAL